MLGLGDASLLSPVRASRILPGSWGVTYKGGGSEVNATEVAATRKSNPSLPRGSEVNATVVATAPEEQRPLLRAPPRQDA